MYNNKLNVNYNFGFNYKYKAGIYLQYKWMPSSVRSKIGQIKLYLKSNNYTFWVSPGRRHTEKDVYIILHNQQECYQFVLFINNNIYNGIEHNAFDLFDHHNFNHKKKQYSQQMAQLPIIQPKDKSQQMFGFSQKKKGHPFSRRSLVTFQSNDICSTSIPWNINKYKHSNIFLNENKNRSFITLKEYLKIKKMDFD